MTSKVTVIDHGLCNVNSITQALKHCGGDVRVTGSVEGLGDPTHVVLPGVGAFPAAMEMLHRTCLSNALTDLVVERKTPVLGICLGMQLMMTVGEEVKDTPGLGWVPGRVTRIAPLEGERVPHVGWNTVNFRPSCNLSLEYSEPRDFYFLHSFHVVPDNPETIAATTPIGGGIVSVLRHESVWGVQFHAEKSQEAGFTLLRSFLASGGA